jgi:two-component system cell cycle sensor histidine kinase/response regulator CckA
VRAAHPLFARVAGPSVAVEVTGAQAPAPVLADRVGVEQVLLNLVINARDAMSDRGRIVIRVAASPDGSAPAELSVADDGRGMDEATRARAFDPFFTTKADGTGLGRSTVRDMVERCGGAVTLESRAGAGTTVTVRLPAAAAAVGVPASAPEPVPAKDLVLLVDDEQAVRRTTRRLLEAEGYTVVEASTVAAALEALSSHPSIAIVVTDLMMPDGGGRAVRDAVAGRVPVLFVSGFDGFEDIPEDALLLKPYTRAVLSARLRAALGR